MSEMENGDGGEAGQETAMTNLKCGQNICSVNVGNLTAGIKSHSPDAKTCWRFKVILFKLAILAKKET